MTYRPPVCLSIGSSDSCGGAGIQGDIKAFAAVGCYSATVVVGLTAQSPSGVRSKQDLPTGFIRDQFDALEGLHFEAVKVGATWSRAVIGVVHEFVSPLRDSGVPIVVDPVLGSSAGSRLYEDGGLLEHVRTRLLPLGTVVTPNSVEARLLVNYDSSAPQAATAKALLDLGPQAVAVSPGPGDVHLHYEDADGPQRFTQPRHTNGADHGAGCAQSSTIAGYLAHGRTTAGAVALAHALVCKAVERGTLNVGTSGIHPVDVLDLRNRREARGDDNSL